MKNKFKFGVQTLLIALLVLSSFPSLTLAGSSDLEVSGWIPYWNDSNGIEDAKDNIKNIDTIFPFAYSVTSSGALKDLAGLDEREWTRFKRTTDRKEIEMIPTVMWSSGEDMHRILSHPIYRMLHVLQIALMVIEGEYDGVDIDYEGKWADTHDHFATFLKELSGVLDDKILSCTIEARTPPESLYHVVPKNIEYANDFKAIAKHCDRVQLMAYDQQRADIKLNSEKRGEPYMPVADVDWVEKVLKLALEDIPKEKAVLGVPTYGHHYTVTVAPDWYKDYTRIGALNLPDMLDVADEYDVEPSRNKAGEMSFSYVHKSSNLKLSKRLDIPRGTDSGNIIAARALAYANETGETVQFRIGWYSDAKAIKDKIELAEDYNLKGVALFKIDGEEDSKVWRYLR